MEERGMEWVKKVSATGLVGRCRFRTVQEVKRYGWESEEPHHGEAKWAIFSNIDKTSSECFTELGIIELRKSMMMNKDRQRG